MSRIRKFETGVPGLDTLTHGGIPEGRSTLITGRSGTGKTVMALQIAAGLALGGNESYPGIFQPFGGFADGVPVRNSRSQKLTIVP